ncbi:hypothetical protein ATANTOWER_009687 [Ataeniobius toweri]|uniref:Uncharacterized protein n=1 Tax=Ataeniobius toweri TaxID=208326 RepID=A0ABU7A6S4_9TELE|nr:hypothetical protein [Ataeniobius toweri]
MSLLPSFHSDGVPLDFMRTESYRTEAAANSRRMSCMTRNKNRRSFGASAPPFLDYLKDILRRYPDGGQILKVRMVFTL